MIDLSTLPRTVTVAVGSREELPLPSYAGSGNQWSARCIEGAAARVWVEVGAAPTTAASPDAEPPTIALAPEKAVILGVAPGKAKWQLVLARSFDAAVTAVREIDVRVE